MRKLSGIPGCAGIAIGKAFVFTEDDNHEIPHYSLARSQLEPELKRLEAAYEAAEKELTAIHERALMEMSNEQANIFAAHILMIQDPDIRDQTAERIRNNLENPEWVIWDITRALVQRMTASSDPAFRDRAVDISDVSKRILNQLLGIRKVSLAELDEDVIIVARDLLPSEILTMSKTRVKAMVMDHGGRSSHAAILARAFNIPAVLGLSTGSGEILNDDILVVDGSNGEVLVNPDKENLAAYQKASAKYQKKLIEYSRLKDLPAETKDGCRVMLKANIELPEEAETVVSSGAEGIGLYRSEFLFLSPGRPMDEERQFEAYRRVLKTMGNLAVTIRTVDIGGDKILPDFQDTNEKNPLLGWRAIRFSLAQPELFKTQLKAILRASIYGNVRIMFPLISGLEELEQALAIFDEARAECRRKGRAFAEQIETGIMIEVPSAAMIADVLAKKSDFFSIGTNDLIQYSLAVDRGNERVNYLAQPAHPALIRFLKTTIDAAHKRGIKAAMCGEMAGDPAYTALLLGLGLDEFSMTASSIPQVKKVIRSLTIDDCRTLTKEILRGVSSSANSSLLGSWMKEHFPG